jgi:hypothetical protein
VSCPEFENLVANLRAYIKLVYPDEMTPHAKIILERILESHEEKAHARQD